MSAPFEARRRREKYASGRPFVGHALLAVATLGCLLAPPLAAPATVATVADPSSGAQAAQPRAASPTGAEPAPAGDAALVAAQAIGAYIGRQSRGADKNLSEAERRLRAVIIVDAVWHLATRPIADDDAGAAPTAHEADYLNAVAQTAATYPNLGGVAAYAAWYTYRHTGNADLAMRVGVQSAAASRAFPANGETLLDAAGGRARQAAVAGAVGGLAVAAAGGDQRAIDEAFLLDGGMLLVQDGYKRYIGSVLAARATEEDAYCLAAMGADCAGTAADAVYVRDEKGAIVYQDGKPRLDPARRARNRDAGERTGKWDGERSAFKHSEATLAGLNALTLFRAQWAISWDMAGLKAPGRLAPAIVITYTGSGAPYYEMLRVSALGVDEKRKTPGVRVMQLSAAEGPTSTPLEFGTNSAFEAFACEDDGSGNSLVVDQPDGTSTNCRALEIAGDGRVAQVGDGGQVDECARMAENHIREKIQMGQSCFVRQVRASEALPGGGAMNLAHEPAASGVLGACGVALLALLSGAAGYLLRARRGVLRRRRARQV